MKQSKYNVIKEVQNGFVLYNSKTDALILLQPELKNLLDKCNEQPELLAQKHPSFYRHLVDLNFLVPDEVDESEELIQRMIQEDASTGSFELTINTTLDCNLRCWYCYEQHKKGTKIDGTVMNSIKKLIQQKLQNSETKHFCLSFFGGEPLMVYQDTIKPLTDFSLDLCKSLKKTMSLGITSNATLLTQESICDFTSWASQITVSWQITLDGNREWHNKTKKTERNEGTYEQVLHHVQKLLENGQYVTLRLNYTQSNLLSFYDVLDDLTHRKINTFDKLQISFQQVWQETDISGTEIEEVKKAYKKEGFRILPGKFNQKQRCYANRPNSLVINYDGTVFKCTAQDFTWNSKEGILDQKGTVHLNETFRKRMENKYKNQACRSCIIFPLCAGGCSQKHLQLSDRCIMGFNKEDKEKIIQERIQYIADVN